MHVQVSGEIMIKNPQAQISEEIIDRRNRCKMALRVRASILRVRGLLNSSKSSMVWTGVLKYILLKPKDNWGRVSSFLFY